MTKRASVQPPPRPERLSLRPSWLSRGGLIFVVAGTLIGTAIVQATRIWVNQDAYDSEVLAAVAPVQQTAEAALQATRELTMQGLQQRKDDKQKDIYALETDQQEHPKLWNTRDERRLDELKAELAVVDADIVRQKEQEASLRAARAAAQLQQPAGREGPP